MKQWSHFTSKLLTMCRSIFQLKSSNKIWHALTSVKWMRVFHWCGKHFPISFSGVNIVRFKNKFLSFGGKPGKLTFHITSAYGLCVSSRRDSCLYYLCIIERHSMIYPSLFHVTIHIKPQWNCLWSFIPVSFIPEDIDLKNSIYVECVRFP